ncbi:MAG: zf-HC2 domain-containing protein [Oscillibacter sp.]|nr:zf-HC2 domain-containing protein [Oscillibacter sp.]
MNSHDKYAALLDAFIDGELSAQEAGEVREHLTLCADCQAYVSDALAMRDAFPDIEETVVPDGFAESVLAALPPRQIPWRTQWKKFMLPLAACLAVFLLVRGLPRIGESTGSGDVYKIGDAVSESVTSDTDAGGGTPMLSVAYNPDDADTMPSADAGYVSDDADTVPPAGAAHDSDDADTVPPADTGYVSDDADTADYRFSDAPQANSPAESAASKKSAPEQQSAAESVPEEEEAPDGVPLASGSVDTESATAPDTVNAAAPIPEPERDAFGDSVPENAEAELYAAPSVWTVPAEAAPLLKSYDRAGETTSGVWYALTAAEFDALSLQLADSDMEAVPGGDTPPTTSPDAEYYIFVPL